MQFFSLIFLREILDNGKKKKKEKYIFFLINKNNLKH